MFRSLLGTGERLGMRFEYVEQPSPDGLAQAFVLGEEFVAGEPSCLILGDNVFYGHGMTGTLRRGAATTDGALVFGYYVRDPERYGVVEFDASGRAISIEEKPSDPKTHYAVPGLYFYGPDVCAFARALKPSKRGELEITDLNRVYLGQQRLRVEVLGRGIAWLDTGTNQSLMEAGQFVHAIEERQGLKIGCLEEIAFQQGWIDSNAVAKEADSMGNSAYAEYLRDVLRRSKQK